MRILLPNRYYFHVYAHVWPNARIKLPKQVSKGSNQCSKRYFAKYEFEFHCHRTNRIRSPARVNIRNVFLYLTASTISAALMSLIVGG